MNAPAAIPLPEPVFDEELIGAYGAAITNLMPQSFGEDLELRCRLLRARESALTALKHCADDTAPLLQEIVRLSMLYTYASVPVERLRALVMCLRRLMSASAWADTAFGDDDARE